MKSSHFTTPRTMEDCQFALNADPIEAYPKQEDWHTGMWFAFACFAMSVGVIAAVALEWI